MQTHLKKLKTSHGFTVAELVISIAVIALMCVIIATGLPLTLQSYNTVTMSAEANILASTLQTALADELRYATDIHTSDTVVTWTGNNCGALTTLYNNDNKRVKLVSLNTPTTPTELLSDKAYTSKLAAKASISYEAGIFFVILTIISADDTNKEWLTLNFEVSAINI